VRSRSKRTRGAGTDTAQRESTGAGVLVSAQQASPDRRTAGGVEPSSNGRRASQTQPPPRGTSLRALKNWRVRSRLFLLVIIPTVTAVALGGLRVASSVTSAEVYQRVGQLASLSGKIAGLVQALQNERQDTAQYIVLNPDGRANGLSSSRRDQGAAAPELAVLQQDYGVTSGWATQARTLLRTIGNSYPALAQLDASSALAAISRLSALRTGATRSQLPALVVIQKYTAIINTLLAIDDQVAVGSNDSTLADTVRVAGLMSAIKEEVSEQQVILSSVQLTEQFSIAQQTAITDAEAEQQGNLAAFNSNATSAQQQLYHDAVSGTSVVNAQQQEQQAISVASSGQAPASDPTIANASAAMSYLVTSLRSVEQRLVNSVIARGKALRNSAITSVIVDSLAVLLVLALALIFTTTVGTSMVRPLRRLRSGALEVAGLRLPEAVRRMNETDGEAVSPEVEPIDVDSSDEIGEVARAFDQVHREALRLASNEAALRGNVNAMFVNLSRRSQSLVERQIRLIDELEQGEQNSERLSSLFQMDHLATLMRRNSENLLVLAGHDVSRRWNKPVALVDVLRAAVSEIEQYERVTLNVQPGIAVRGQAVSDVVHLTAELVENATSFSPADTPVSIVGHLLSSGGVLLEIADQGVGMGAEEMAHANWRLDNPPVVDVAVSRRMGLFVVARLAARHSVRVRLRPAASGGLTALVWLPDEVITHETPGSSGFPGRFDSAVTPAAGGGGAVSGTGMWGQTGRSAAEQEVSAARAPRFAPLLADAGGTALGPRRVPGAGPMPGGGRWAATATGPMPAFRTSPQPGPGPGPRRDAEEFIPSPQPVAEAERFGAGSGPVAGAGAAAAPPAGFDSYPGEVAGAGTGPRPVIGSEQRGGGSAAGTGWATEAGSASFSGSGSGQRPVPAVPAGPVNGLGGSAGSVGGYDWGSGSAGGGVVVPPPAAASEANRLPIFEAVESDWFRRGRHAVSRPGGGDRPSSSAADSGPGGGAGGGADSGSWTSAADEGWRAAAAASAPTSGGVTSAGLPKRVPKANLVPGTVADAPAAPAPALTRSAAVTRERFSSFQRGIRQGRAVAGGEDPEGAEDSGSG
jgi:Nitrate and nitrite sensing/HAMP domain